jgi:putative transposase
VQSLPSNGNAIGVDAGLEHLLTLSTGEKITNPRYVCRDRARLARAARELSRKAKGDGSNRAKAGSSPVGQSALKQEVLRREP